MYMKREREEEERPSQLALNVSTPIKTRRMSHIRQSIDKVSTVQSIATIGVISRDIHCDWTTGPRRVQRVSRMCVFKGFVLLREEILKIDKSMKPLIDKSCHASEHIPSYVPTLRRESEGLLSTRLPSRMTETARFLVLFIEEWNTDFFFLSNRSLLALMEIGTCYPCSKHLLVVLNLFFWVGAVCSTAAMMTMKNFVSLAEWVDLDRVGLLFSSSIGSSTCDWSVELHFATVGIDRNLRQSVDYHRCSDLSHWTLRLLWRSARISDMSHSCSSSSRTNGDEDRTFSLFSTWFWLSVFCWWN